MAKSRARLWAMIPALGRLDFLMLTKRPHAYRSLMPATIRALPNIWPGVTVESPEYLWRVEQLLAVEGIAGPRWASYEPALAAVDFAPYLGGVEQFTDSDGFRHTHMHQPGLAWLVVGCESFGGRAGRNAAGYEACARRVIEQGRAAGVPIFHKQMPIDGRVSHDPSEWREDLRVREFPR